MPVGLELGIQTYIREHRTARLRALASLMWCRHYTLRAQRLLNVEYGSQCPCLCIALDEGLCAKLQEAAGLGKCG